MRADNRARCDQRAVVLNASYEPLNVVPVERAIGYVARGKVEVLWAHETPLRSPTFSTDRPHVVILRAYVRIPHAATAPGWTKAGVLHRDRRICVYCGARGAATIDHLVPVSHGGPSSWLNTAAACTRCNQAKADRTPVQAGLVLKYQPRVPDTAAWRRLITESDRHVLRELGAVL